MSTAPTARRTARMSLMPSTTTRQPAREGGTAGGAGCCPGGCCCCCSGRSARRGAGAAASWACRLPWVLPVAARPCCCAGGGCWGERRGCCCRCCACCCCWCWFASCAGGGGAGAPCWRPAADGLEVGPTPSLALCSRISPDMLPGHCRRVINRLGALAERRRSHPAGHPAARQCNRIASSMPECWEKTPRWPGKEKFYVYFFSKYCQRQKRASTLGARGWYLINCNACRGCVHLAFLPAWRQC